MPQSLKLKSLLYNLNKTPLCAFHFVVLLGFFLISCIAKLILVLMCFDLGFKYSLDSSSAQRLDLIDIDHTDNISPCKPLGHHTFALLFQKEKGSACNGSV